MIKRMNWLLGSLILLMFIVFPSSAHTNNLMDDRTNISDEWIATTLKAVMEEDGRLDLGQIQITSDHDQVTLDGTVLTDFERAHAERLAGDIPGVRAVVNNLRVVPPLDSDIALSQQIRTAILQSPLLRVSSLRVTVRDGAVQLRGIVSSPAQKAMIDRMIRWFGSVTSIANEISVVGA